MPQVYVVVYSDENTTCLIAEKKTRGFYFAGVMIDAVQGQILNYSGQDVFPGGALNDDEDPQAGAIREFGEETGLDLAGVVTLNSALKSFNAQGANIAVAGGAATFHCFYVNVSPDVLAKVVTDVTHNLSLALPGKRGIVADDELRRVFIRAYPGSRNTLTTFVAQRADAQYDKSRNKGWFGDIMDAIP
jgi:hypothetical protein